MSSCLLVATWSAVPAAGGDPPEDLAVAQLRDEVREKGWIAYGARSVNGDFDLFLCRPDGSNVRPLTRTRELSEFSPQFSRDGRKLLYRRVPRGETLDNNRHGEQGTLILANADGSSPAALGKPGEFAWASFNADGTEIATLSIKGVSIVNLARREVIRTLPRKGFFQQMTWSPDGKWLCGVANSFGASWSIARMNPFSGEAEAVNKIDCCTPDWFPDSLQIIFSWRPPGQKANKGYGWTQLWRATADGVTRSLVYAEEGRHVYGGNVSPDGKYVIFTGNIEEDGDPGRAGAPMGLIRLRDAPMICGESPEFRALHPGTSKGPALTLPTGWEPSWTASETPAEDSPRSANATNPEAEELRGELREKGWLVFSAKTVAGDWDLFAMRPDGSERQHVTDTRSFNEAGARFSRDGRRLLYYRLPVSESPDNNTYGTFDLVLANGDGSDPEVWGTNFHWASWSPDGRQLACLGPKTVQFVDVTTRTIIRELPRKGIVSQLVWSPDGTRFTATANGLGQFWNIGCLDAKTGEIHPLGEQERYNCTSDWAPDSGHVLYARGIIPPQPGRAELWMAEADGLNRRRIYAEPERHIYGACASPDGKYAVFTRSANDLGKVPDIEMAVIRLRAPSIEAAVKPGSRLDLGAGWEPDWTQHLYEPGP